MEKEKLIEYMRKVVACNIENPIYCLSSNCYDCSHDYPMEPIELLNPAEVIEIVEVILELFDEEEEEDNATD